MKEPAQCNTRMIEELQSRIRTLEHENRLLKERLEEAGISYVDIVPDNSIDSSDLFDPDQGARIKKFEVTDKIASNFFLMFCRGRKDVYELRCTNPQTGKNGYYTQCFHRWDRGCHIQNWGGCSGGTIQVGSGAHLWSFFKEMVPARLTRRFGYALLEKDPSYAGVQ